MEGPDDTAVIGSAAIVREFWRLMATNDFVAASALLADGFILEWPQSNETFHGRERYARLNAEYPAHGRWAFTVHRIVAGHDEAVSDVTVTDGVQHARAISFFTISGGMISRLVEYWPEPYDPPAYRRHMGE